MSDVKPKKIKLDPEAAVPQPAATSATAKPDIHRMRRADLIQEVKEERKNMKQLISDFKRDMDVVNKKNAEMTTENDCLRQQIQQEMSKNDALRQQILEHELSKLSAMQLNTTCVQEMSMQILEVTQRCLDFQEQLNQIKKENTCSICLSPWEAEGDHCVVSLQCGHLFGELCILQHLGNHSKCPLCKQSALLCNTRHIYGSHVLPVPRQQTQTSNAVQDTPAAQPVRRQPAQLEQQAASTQLQPDPSVQMTLQMQLALPLQLELPLQPAPTVLSAPPLQPAPPVLPTPPLQPAPPVLPTPPLLPAPPLQPVPPLLLFPPVQRASRIVQQSQAAHSAPPMQRAPRPLRAPRLVQQALAAQMAPLVQPASVSRQAAAGQPAPRPIRLYIPGHQDDQDILVMVDY